MASKKNSTKNFAQVAAARAIEFEKHKQEEVQRSERRSADNKFALLVSAGAVVVALALQLAYFGFGPGYVASDAKPESSNGASVPNPSLAENRTWNGSMTVGKKKLQISLDGKNAPQAVANFLSLSSKNFFNGISCHRLTTQGLFVLQCGDPNGDGTGGPGYTWGPIENAPKDDVYKKGVLAMARRGGDGNSMGSQFFIVYKDSKIPADGAGGYTVFGEITGGLEQLNSIFKAGVTGGNTDGAPAKPTQLGSITLK